MAKLSYDDVNERFKSEGYTLLSTSYIGVSSKLLVMCPKGHKYSVNMNNWRRGDRCLVCSGQGKPSIMEVRKSFEKEGYKLISDEYINNRGKLDYICPEGHVHGITWSDWKNKGNRCPYCNGRPIITTDIVKESMNKEGYTLLSSRYNNNHTMIDCLCSNGHLWSVSWRNWVTGYRCKICASINRSGPGHHNWQGGKSFEVYCSEWKDKEYKKEIRERDGQICINPYCSKMDKRLSIHHIDYNKKNCRPSNLVTVCGSCNSKANYDREWHTSWYRALLKNRYGYKY